MKSCNIGAVVLATDQGLGYLAKDFYDNGVIKTVYVHPHTSRINHYEWYKNRVNTPRELLSCDAIMFFEEVFYWNLIPEARKVGVKTVLMPMYECTRNPLPYEPDIIITPSDLDQQYYPKGVRINVPVSVPWKLRQKATHFVHNAGNGGLGGRNGTKELIEAMAHVKSPIKLTIRSQKPIPVPKDPRIQVCVGTVPFNELWECGDVFIFPEKFNGLSLPLQEAFASGMLVMCGNRFPMNKWLPTEPLIPVAKYTQEKIALRFDSAVISPTDIANTIDKWYNSDITELSYRGKSWGEANSWGALKENYFNIICDK